MRAVGLIDFDCIQSAIFGDGAEFFSPTSLEEEDCLFFCWVHDRNGQQQQQARGWRSIKVYLLWVGFPRSLFTRSPFVDGCVDDAIGFWAAHKMRFGCRALCSCALRALRALRVLYAQCVTLCLFCRLFREAAQSVELICCKAGDGGGVGWGRVKSGGHSKKLRISLYAQVLVWKFLSKMGHKKRVRICFSGGFQVYLGRLARHFFWGGRGVAKHHTFSSAQCSY